MNLVDAVVIRVLSTPTKIHNHWFVFVEYNCYGVLGKTNLMLNTKSDALKVKKGYKFLT